MLFPLFLILLFIAVSVPLLAVPLRRREEVASTVPGDEGAEPAGYEEVLLALRDLEFDHDLGVVSDDDYARLRERLMAEAATALESAQRREEEVASAHIEDAVRALRTKRQANGRAVTRFCPQCGNPVDAGDRFCTGCGASLL